MRACHFFCNKASACREWLPPFQKLQRRCRMNDELPQGRLIKVRSETLNKKLMIQLTQSYPNYLVLRAQFGQSTHMSTLFGEVH